LHSYIADSDPASESHLNNSITQCKLAVIKDLKPSDEDNAATWQMQKTS